MGNSVDEMRLSKPRPATDKQRIVAPASATGRGDGRCVR